MIIKDSKTRPDLFEWYGPIASRRLRNWVAELGFRVTDELFELWCKTGGGEMFETETLLAPFGDPDTGDDVISVNRYHREKGMSQDYLIFHVGLGGFTALGPDGDVVILDNTYSETDRFDSVTDWYRDAIRDEYKERYDL